MTTIKLVSYLVFLFLLAIWMGAAFQDTYSTNGTWYKDPLTHIKHLNSHPVPGALNPWPLTTALLTLGTIISLILFINYNGPGKWHAQLAIGGTLIVLISTFLYFVPGLIRMFGKTANFTDDQLITMSHQWVIWNVIRLILLMVLFITGLIGLVKFYKP
jgi:hypothetical protein